MISYDDGFRLGRVASKVRVGKVDSTKRQTKIVVNPDSCVEQRPLSKRTRPEGNQLETGHKGAITKNFYTVLRYEVRPENKFGF